MTHVIPNLQTNDPNDARLIMIGHNFKNAKMISDNLKLHGIWHSFSHKHYEEDSPKEFTLLFGMDSTIEEIYALCLWLKDFGLINLFPIVKEERYEDVPDNDLFMTAFKDKRELKSGEILKPINVDAFIEIGSSVTSMDEAIIKFYGIIPINEEDDNDYIRDPSDIDDNGSRDGWSRDTIDNAFDGDSSNIWNVD